jgi:hypothetical protein
MITSADFDAAIKLISEYRDQMVNIVKENNSSKDKTINIKKQISSGTFKALREYYKNEFGMLLDDDHLATMNVKLLSTIDCDKLLNTRGFGKAGLKNFKKLLNSNSIINKGLLIK